MASLTVEYRKIGQLPTCVGNERLRITSDGRVSHSRNTSECEEGRLWRDDWRDVGRLEPAAVTELARGIAASGILELEPSSIDETAEGGKREEIDLSLDAAEYHFVVQNTDPPAFRRVVRLLWGTMAGLAP